MENVTSDAINISQTSIFEEEAKGVKRKSNLPSIFGKLGERGWGKKEKKKEENQGGEEKWRDVPSECDDVTKRGGRQQKAIAAGYRTREDTDGLRRPPF